MNTNRSTLRTVVCLACLAACCETRAFTFTQGPGISASSYANPFDPNGDGVRTGTEASTVTAGPIGGGTAGEAVSLDNVVNRHDSRSGANAGAGRIQGTASQGYMQWVASAPFTAGTVVSAQHVGASFTPAMAFTLKLDGTTVQTGTGTANSHDIRVTTLAPAPVTTLRNETNMCIWGGATGTTYADMQEILVLPDPLARIPATVSGTAGGGGVGTVYDLNGDTAANQWYTSTASAYFQLDFGAPTTVQALVLANWENIPIADLTIRKDGAGGAVLLSGVQLVGNGNYGDFAALRFNTSVTTSALRFEFNNAGGTSVGMREVIAFSVVPEPASALLLGLALAAAARPSRRR